MKKLSFVFAFLTLGIVGMTPGSYAQEVASTGYNPHSLYPVHESHIMFKKTLWRRVDLKEKQNRPFFAFNNEITKIIIEGVKAGVLPIYANDSLTTRMTKEQFLENLKLPETGGGLTEEEKALGFTDQDSGWGDDSGWGTDDSSTASADAAVEEELFNEFLPNEISILEIKEDMIFDKKRS